jgi:hypothetical protein
MERLTGNRQYVDTARQVAAEAVSRLYYKGMFRSHAAKPYYESIDDVGDLLTGLLELHELTASQIKAKDSASGKPARAGVRGNGQFDH